MTNWNAVAEHLAREVMGWRQRGERLALHRFWADHNNNYRVLVVDWKPYEKWSEAGMVLDKMHQRHCRYILDSWLAFGYEAEFRSPQSERLALVTGQETLQKAIALAAALATGYVEKEKTEAEILLDKLHEIGLPHTTGIEERTLELFEQSFERVRTEMRDSDTTERAICCATCYYYSVDFWKGNWCIYGAKRFTNSESSCNYWQGRICGNCDHLSDDKIFCLSEATSVTTVAKTTPGCDEWKKRNY